MSVRLGAKILAGISESDLRRADVENGRVVAGKAANAEKLNGYESKYFASAEDLIAVHSTSVAQLSVVGWYRVAEYESSDSTKLKGSSSNVVDLHIKRWFGSNSNEYHWLRLRSTYTNQEIVSLDSKSNTHGFTKARYTYDSNKAYLEVYNSLSSSNACIFEVAHPFDGGFTWKAITPVLTEETIDGVTVTTIYDIPANASPVTNLAIKKALEYTEFTSGFDLNNALGKYRTSNSSVLTSLINKPPYSSVSGGSGGEATVEWFPADNQNTYGTQIFRYTYNTTVLVYMRSRQNTTWTTWHQIVTIEDLADFLKLSGGELTGKLTISIEATDNEDEGIVIKRQMGTEAYIETVLGSLEASFFSGRCEINQNEIKHKGNMFASNMYVGSASAGYKEVATIESGKFTLSYGTYTFPGYKYCKIGKFVYVYGMAPVPANMTLNNGATFSGLPFEVEGGGYNAYLYFGVNMSYNPSNIATCFKHELDDTSIKITENAELPAGVNIQIVGMYITSD